MIVDYVVWILVFVFWLEQEVLVVVVEYVDQLFLILLSSLFLTLLILTSLLEHEIIRPVLSDHVAADQFDSVCHVSILKRLVHAVSFVKVEESVALLLLPEPSCHLEFGLDPVSEYVLLSGYFRTWSRLVLVGPVITALRNLPLSVTKHHFQVSLVWRLAITRVILFKHGLVPSLVYVGDSFFEALLLVD